MPSNCLINSLTKWLKKSYESCAVTKDLITNQLKKKEIKQPITKTTKQHFTITSLDAPTSKTATNFIAKCLQFTN